MEPNITQEQLLDLLEVDYENAGMGRVKIVCPFHDDTHPSMLIYPDYTEACHCFACDETCSWPWLLAKVRGCSFPEACRMLQFPDGNYGNGETRGQIRIDVNFCDEPRFVEQFTKKHEACLKNYPISGTKYLEKKGLCRVAQDLDWRWHDGSQFKRWGNGIVIPYKVDGKVVWERFRKESIEGNFEKPIGPVDVPIQPYLTTFRKNDVVYIVEGESDAASIYAHGGSAIGLPGAKSKKCINTVACLINDNDYITKVVLCGDMDTAGQDMNKLCREALGKFVERKLEIDEYQHQVQYKKADVNDDHARGLLKIPLKAQCVYGANHERNFGPFGGVVNGSVSSQEATGEVLEEKTEKYKERIVEWLKKRFTH